MICPCVCAALKADKAVIKASVDQLLALKAQYQELTGHAFGASAASPSGPSATIAKDEKSKATGDATKQKSKPKKTAPAEQKSAPAAAARCAAAPPKAPALSISTSVWSGSTVDIALLEAKLKVFSYVGGYEPSAEDNR